MARGSIDIFNAAPVAFVFDFLELFFEFVQEQQRLAFAKLVNRIFLEEVVVFRMAADGYVYKIDSAYFDNEILNRTLPLLQSPPFEAVQHHFNQALLEYSRNNWNSVLIESSNALEAALQALTGKKGKHGALVKALRASGKVPNFYEGFWDAFEKLLHGVFTARSQGAAHPSPVDADKSLAQFALNQVATNLLFLIELGSPK